MRLATKHLARREMNECASTCPYCGACSAVHRIGCSLRSGGLLAQLYLVDPPCNSNPKVASEGNPQLGTRHSGVPCWSLRVVPLLW